MNEECKRGQIYLADLGRPQGSVQGGIRPVLIIQNDVGNFYAPIIQIAPFTARTYKKPSQPTHCLIRHVRGLRRDSVVLLEQTRVLDKTKLKQYLGTLTPEQMELVNTAIQTTFGLPVSQNTKEASAQ